MWVTYSYVCVGHKGHVKLTPMNGLHPVLWDMETDAPAAWILFVSEESHFLGH